MPSLPATDTPKRPRWQRSFALLLAVLLGGMVVAYAAWRVSLDLALAQTRDDAQRHLRFVAHELTGALDKYEAVPQVLARRDQLWKDVEASQLIVDEAPVRSVSARRKAGKG